MFLANKAILGFSIMRNEALFSHGFCEEWCLKRESPEMQLQDEDGTTVT